MGKSEISIVQLTEAPPLFKKLILAFALSLSIGYAAGFKFIFQHTSLRPQGIEEQYLGNENDMEAVTMKFKKSENEILTTIHGHIISFSIIFFILSLIIYGLPIRKQYKKLLLFEPFFSVILTFGGIYLMWLGLNWMKWVIAISGFAMTFTFVTDISLIIYYLWIRGKRN